MSEGNYVLIVEDDDDSRVLFSTILTRNHYAVMVAETADKARKILATHPKKIGAILLDLMLPGGEDGLSLARSLRKQDNWREVPIIAVTARLFDAEQGNVFEAGCNAHLAKPIVARDLLDILSLYMGSEKSLSRA